METFSVQKRLWQEVCILTMALLIVWGVVLWPLANDQTTYMASILAGTSGILLALTFSLSSFSYYFDFLDRQVVYRKQLGLMGYFVALGYVWVVASQNPERYWYSFPENLFSAEVGLGLAAMVILTGMAFVSNARAAQWLGGKIWKGILGLGYIAYALLIIRAIFLDGPHWGAWLATGEPGFTVRMGLTVLGVAVLFFRVSVPFHRKFIKKENYV